MTVAGFAGVGVTGVGVAGAGVVGAGVLSGTGVTLGFAGVLLSWGAGAAGDVWGAVGDVVCGAVTDVDAPLADVEGVAGASVAGAVEAGGVVTGALSDCAAFAEGVTLGACGTVGLSGTDGAVGAGTGAGAGTTGVGTVAAASVPVAGA
ncbi:hypothetical protein AD939_06955 [Gluconobacter oxydans]|uniref:hypothetical protein n=1 Tax=Gluconobacter oxydans TaxID=442 RepID=UPI000782EB58|nr:hypothetical protein [Gluconobacter oxydans]KXV31488.1 hypothetical protein AD939_06955 [Gluconobacter oxydans]